MFPLGYPTLVLTVNGVHTAEDPTYRACATGGDVAMAEALHALAGWSDAELTRGMCKALAPHAIHWPDPDDYSHASHVLARMGRVAA